MAEQGVSEAFYAAVLAIGRLAGVKPLPNGLTTVTGGDWTLTINTSAEPLMHDGSEVTPYTVVATHQQFLVICVIGPNGGIIGGGMTEAEFIADMQAIASEVPA